MATTRATLRAAIAVAIADATTVLGTAQADGWLGVKDAESDINQVRAALSALLPQISTEWGVDGYPLHAALRQLAARLLDLRAAVTDVETTVVEQLDRPTSLIELAVRHYGDYTRWTDISALNPNLRHPGDIRPGTSVVRHAR